MQLPGDISTCGTTARVFAQPRPTSDIGRIEIPQRSSLPRCGGVLSFRSETREARTVKRREFITLLGGAAAAAWPRGARAQRTKNARIGFLGLVSPSSHAARVAALRAGLRDLGWVEGRNIDIEFRWAEGNYDRLGALAEELVRLNVDVLVTHATSGALAAKKATSTIPIVITAVADMLAVN